MICRVCSSGSVSAAGEVEYFSGFSWGVYDCGACGSRFTRHDGTVHDRFHESGALSYYLEYGALAAEAKGRFDQGDREGLQALLSSNSKYRFVMNALRGLTPPARLLEIGTSRGYLTASFVLNGHDALGVDVSPAAVEGARTAFGDHFALSGDPRIRDGVPYDAIFHVGLIGCVEDPAGLTRELLEMLKPGGRLLFNAPNRKSCSLRKQLWLDSAPPPDLVTLFAPGYWASQFADLAETSEEIEVWPIDKSLAIGLRERFGPAWRKPVPRTLGPSTREFATESKSTERMWRLFERAVVKAGRMSGLSRFVHRRPFDFGIFVTMVKR